ncbi:MAG: hypothetical protein OQL06_13885 [Gammaproteobacteria bacterium]|nr:hypothetical protein [Gammaproteobacteria bacterium]
MKKLVAVINGESTLEYDRSVDLPANQRAYLDKMDEKMDTGIPHGQGNIFAPQMEQKAQFVADQLVMAIKADNEGLIAASMAYLASRLPDLKQVTAEEQVNGETKITLVYDQEYVKPEAINFIKPTQLDS